MDDDTKTALTLAKRELECCMHASHKGQVCFDGDDFHEALTAVDKALAALTAPTNEAAAHADGRELEPTAMRLARLIITEHYADEPSAESLVDEAWSVLGCLPETVVNRALDLTHGARMPYEQALNLAISEHATQPVQAQGEGLPDAMTHAAGKQMAVTKEWCRGWDDCRAALSAQPVAGEPVAFMLSDFLDPTNCTVEPICAAPAVDRGLSEAMAEHIDEAEATLKTAHGIMVALDKIERNVGPIGSHARGCTHKITNALRHLSALRSSLAASAPSQAEPVRPDLLERLSYHALERDDLSLDEVLDVLSTGWRKVRGRTERQMLLQLLALMASAPAAQAVPSHAGSCQASGEWATVEVNQGFPALMEALDRAARKGYMPGSMTAEWEAFEYRLPFSGEVAAPPAGRTLTEDRIDEIVSRYDVDEAEGRCLARAILAASSTTAGERE